MGSAIPATRAIGKTGGDNKHHTNFLTSQQLEDIVSDLRKGVAIQAVADFHQDSIGTIKHILRTVPGILDDWTRAQFESARSRFRQCWLDLQLRNPDLSINGLRLIDATTYAWLHRNDCAWLNEHRNADSGGKALYTAEWAIRDERLCQCVRETAARLEHRITPQLLYRHIPELRVLKDSFSMLPLTIKAMDEVIKMHPPGHDLLGDIM
ncbi:hypothetical protein GCM10027296_26550 [Chitinimonas naiadis]